MSACFWADFDFSEMQSWIKRGNVVLFVCFSEGRKIKKLIMQVIC